MRKGFLYYSQSTDRHEQIEYRKLLRTCGLEGWAVYDYILCQIFREDGYFLLYDADRRFFLSESLNKTEEEIDAIVQVCCSVGLFSEHVLQTCQVLTSAAIQEKYILLCKNNRRVSTDIEEKYNLLEKGEKANPPTDCPKMQEEMAKTPTDCPKTPTFTPEMQEECGSKEKKRKEKIISDAPAPAREGDAPSVQPPSASEQEEREMKFQIVLQFLTRGIGNAYDEMQNYWNFYSVNGWKKSNASQTAIHDRVLYSHQWSPSKRNTVRFSPSDGGILAEMLRAAWANTASETLAPLTIPVLCQYAQEFCGCQVQEGTLYMLFRTAEVAHLVFDNVFQPFKAQCVAAIRRVYKPDTISNVKFQKA